MGSKENHQWESVSDGRGLRFYWALLDVFVFTMIVVVLSNSMGLLWIALEASTLVSAFLVGYYQRKTAVEAAWKYILLCTVGITFALNGIILMYYAAIQAGAPKSQALFFTTLPEFAGNMDSGLVKIAFIFIFIGFGSKAGLAPMHSWLPDAHSESPAAISTLLSAVLLKCALYAILRFFPVCDLAVSKHFAGDILIFFGMFSIIIAALFLIRQKGLKRFLAYSSLEHIGIMSVGFGIGNPLAVFGAVFHVLTHALTKSLLFFLAGEFLLKHGTVEIKRLQGLFSKNPLMGILLFSGGLSLIGLPPFAVFISKFYIVWGALKSGNTILAALFLFLLAMVFFTVIFRFTKLVFAKSSNLDATSLSPGEQNTHAPELLYFLPFCLLILLCFYIPSPLLELMNNAVLIISGGRL
jgi:hydrogenase-4 component F